MWKDVNSGRDVNKGGDKKMGKCFAIQNLEDFILMYGNLLLILLIFDPHKVKILILSLDVGERVRIMDCLIDKKVS